MPPQSTAALTQLGQGYAPMADAQAFRKRTGLEGVPLLSGQSGPLGMMTAMGMAGSFHRMQGQAGMVPLGIGHDQNVLDTIRNLQFGQAQQKAMREASESDRAGFLNTFRGLAAISGTPYGAEQRRAASSLAGAATTAAPFLAEAMPEFLDQMGGVRGSATVFAKRMAEGSRYRIDPVTGRTGTSGEGVGEQSNRLFADLYSDRNVADMRGVTAGQLGTLFQQLQARGQVGGAAAEAGQSGLRPDDPRGQVRRAVDDMRAGGSRSLGDLKSAATRAGVDLGKSGGLAGEDLDKLLAMPEVSGKVRAFDSERIKRSLAGHVKAVAAMRDIFGDLGKPDAPMQELIGALEALTAGSGSQLSPGRMADIARKTHNLASQTGVSMDNAMVLQQHAGQRAQQMGLEPIFGVQAAQGALGFGGAYRGQGHAAHTAWGAMNADQLTQLDANLRVQAAGSNMANRMATAVRVRDSAGGFEKGSEAERYTTAIAAGRGTYLGGDGSLKSVNLDDGQFVAMMKSAKGADGKSLNLSENAVRDMTQQSATNREFIDKYQMTNTVRRAQGPEEVHRFVGQRMRETVTAQLRDELVRGGADPSAAYSKASAVASAVAQKVTDRVFDMSTREYADRGSRNAGIADILGDELEKAGHGGVLKGMTAGDRTKFLKGTAERFYGHAERSLQNSDYRAYGSTQNVHRLTNRGTLDEADRQQTQAAQEGQLQEAMSPLGRGTALSRAVDAVRNARADDPDALRTALASSLGGVKTDDINRALLGPMVRVNEHRKKIDSLRDDISKSKDPAARAKLVETLDTTMRELNAQVKDMAEIGERHGMFADDGVGGREVSRTIRSGMDVVRTAADLAGVRTGAGAEVTPEEIDKVMRAPGRMSATDAAGVLVARRMVDADRLEADPTGKTAGAPGRARYASALAHVRRSGGAGMTDDQAHATAIETLRRHADNFEDTQSRREVQALRDAPEVKTPEEARSLIRTRRRTTPGVPEKAMVDAVMKEQGDTITEVEAREVASTRLRASRLGLTPEQVNKRIDEDNKKADPEATPAELRNRREGQGGWRGQVKAIDSLIAEQQDRQYTVRPEDREEFVKKNLPGGVASITDAQVKAFVGADERRKGMKPEEARTAIVNRLVLGERGEETRRRFAAFWKGPDGANFREQVDRHSQDVESASLRLISTPGVVRRLGTRAVEMHKELDANQQRVRELALYHAKGDTARLLGGDVDIDMHTEEGQESRSRVAAEVHEIQRRNRLIMEDLLDTQGKSGTQWAVGDELETTRRVLAGRGTPDSAADARRVRARQAADGTEEKARESLGIPRDKKDLTEYEAAKVEAVRRGVGADAEVVGTVGRAAWEAMPEAARAAAAKTLRKGTGDRAAAAKLLGVKPDAAGKLSAEDEERVVAATEGLESDAHAARIAGLSPAGPTGPAERKRIRRAKQGSASYAAAREASGLDADDLTDDESRRVRARQEADGDAKIAREIARIPAGKSALSEWEEAKVEAVRHGVGDEAEVSGILGKKAYAAMTPAARAEAASKLRRGTGGDRDAAIKLLGVKPDAAGKFTAEDEEKIAAASSGLETNAHAAQLAGYDPKKARTPEENRQVRRLRLGTASYRAAAEAEGVAPKGLTEKEIAEKLAAVPTREQQRQIRVRQMEDGSEDNALDVLGIPRDLRDRGKLTEWQEAKVAAVRYGAGVDEEVAGVVGRTRWDAMTDAEKESARKTLHKGLGTEAAAKAYLKIDPKRTDLSTDERERVVGATHGLFTDTHARHLAGVQDRSELTPAEVKRVHKIRLGTASVEAAREELKLRPGRLTPRERAAVEERAELEGNRDEASRLMRLKPGEPLDDKRREELDRTTREVGVARRLTPEQEKTVADYDKKEKSGRGLTDASHVAAGKAVGELAARLGVSRDELVGGSKVRGRMAEQQAQALAESQKDAQQTVRQLYKAYGVETPAEGQPLSAKQAELASSMNSVAGRGTARRIIETQTKLTDFARRGKYAGAGADQGEANEGIGRMADDYFKALDMTPGAEKDKKLKEFQESVGVDFDRGRMTGKGADTWQQFQRSMQFQQQTRFLQFGKRRGNQNKVDETAADLYRDAMQGGELKPTAGAGADGAGARGGPMDIRGHLTGEFTLRGNKVDMVGDAGGSRHHAVGTA